MKILPGVQILEELESPINGRVRVVRSLGLGTYIQAENLTQSGGVVRGVWKKALSEASRIHPDEIKKCLILGLGGGSSAMIIKKIWPRATVTGVDIDPIMVSLGKKYLGLEGVEVVIQDAKDFALKAVKNSKKYDLVLVDTYRGDVFPRQFDSLAFFKRVKRLILEGGLAIFNRLYYGEKRPQAMRFGAKLEKVFARVDYVFPEANLMFICSSALSTSL